MKVTTTVPTPVPITWHLDLTDDEMADLVGALGSSNSHYTTRFSSALSEAGVKPETWCRFRTRNFDRFGEYGRFGDLLGR